MVTMRDQINPSTKVSKVAYKGIFFMSSNEPPWNYCGVLKEHLIGHVLRGQNGGSTLTHKSKPPIDFIIGSISSQG